MHSMHIEVTARDWHEQYSTAHIVRQTIASANKRLPNNTMLGGHTCAKSLAIDLRSKHAATYFLSYQR